MKLDKLLSVFCIIVVAVFVLVVGSFVVKEVRERKDSETPIAEENPPTSDTPVQDIEEQEHHYETVRLEPHDVDISNLVDPNAEDNSAEIYAEFKAQSEEYVIHYDPSYTIDIDDPDLDRDLSFWATQDGMGWVVVSSLLKQYIEATGTPLSELTFDFEDLDETLWYDTTMRINTNSDSIVLHYTYESDDWAGYIE